MFWIILCSLGVRLACTLCFIVSSMRIVNHFIQISLKRWTILVKETTYPLKSPSNDPLYVNASDFSSWLMKVPSGAGFYLNAVFVCPAAKSYQGSSSHKQEDKILTGSNATGTKQSVITKLQLMPIHPFVTSSIQLVPDSLMFTFLFNFSCFFRKRWPVVTGRSASQSGSVLCLLTILTIAASWQYE